ncbi:MAG: hypothetical protein H7246_06425 [Phycisphaerae bacterium]|nr:hypothetical protein [Saprospiraceae bacterium]
MAKPRTIFCCSNCGASAPKWLGRCPQCNEWNTKRGGISTIFASFT